MQQPDAANALKHFLSNTGNNYNIDVQKLFNDSNDVMNKRNSIINDLLRASEKMADGNGIVIYNTKLINSDAKDDDNWHNTLGDFEIRVKCTSRLLSDNVYSADIELNILDFYDWNPNVTNMGSKPISARDMWELHHGGLAKNFLTNSKIVYNAKWTFGQTVNQGVCIK